MAATGIPNFDRDLGRASFGLKLFQLLANNDPESNTLISPVSIGLLLLMLYEGAAGTTKNEISAALNATDEAALAHSGACWLDALRPYGRDTTIKIANSLWLQQGIALRAEYEKVVTRRYEAWVEELDLHTEDAIRRINEWVHGATGGKIPNILSGVDASVLHVAASAVYFRGNWATPFRVKDTQEQIFYEKDRSTSTPFMRQKGDFAYGENDEFQAIEIPYEGNRLNMYVFLPKRGLADLISQFSFVNWMTWLSCFRDRQGTLELPRFTVRCSAVLNRGLQEIGIRQMFQPSADFSRISQYPSVWIGDVNHECFIELNEQGTEAAAVTIAGTVFGSENPAADRTPFHMVVNRPFLSVVSDSSTGTILFIGAVNTMES